MKAVEEQEACNGEDRVVMYLTPGTDFVESLFAGFRKKYPHIETEYVHEPAARFVDRVIAEIEGGENRADIMLLNRQQGEVLKIKGFIEPYRSPESATFPERSLDPEGYAAQPFIVPFSVAYNTEMVAPDEVPRRYEDLLDPRWKGKLLYPDPRRSGSGSGWYAVMKKYLGEEYFRKLGDQMLNCRAHAEEKLAAGKGAVLVAAIVDRIEGMKEQGLPVDWIPLPVMWFAGPFAVLFRNARHPNAGKRLIDFLLSFEGQRIMGRFHLPNRPGVPIEEKTFARVQEKLQGVELVSFEKNHGMEYSKNQSAALRLFLRQGT